GGGTGGNAVGRDAGHVGAGGHDHVVAHGGLGQAADVGQVDGEFAAARRDVDRRHAVLHLVVALDVDRAAAGGGGGRRVAGRRGAGLVGGDRRGRGIGPGGCVRCRGRRIGGRGRRPGGRGGGGGRGLGRGRRRIASAGGQGEGTGGGEQCGVTVHAESPCG